MIKNTQQRRVNNMRIKGYDYTKDNLFFVTFNVSFKLMHVFKGAARESPEIIPPEWRPQYPHYFGNIVDGKMHLNEFGKIADEQWLWLAKQYPYVRLHEHVVMPDHFHGILEINRYLLKDHPEKETMKIKSLSELMGAFKTTSSKKIRQSGFCDFDWHRSFYGTIIFDMQSYTNMCKYIEKNPAKWHDKKISQKFLNENFESKLH